jgi:SAM-dependent methyltransferase
MPADTRFLADRFPRSAKYHPDWIAKGISGGANQLWLTEWLTEAMDLKPGIRVLDLGCGRGLSSIFLAREFGVTVWSVDLWLDPSERWPRIRDAGLENQVFPLKCDARQLPFARDFFDAIVSIDSYFYYGTDDLFLNELLKLLTPAGRLGIAGAAFVQEIDRDVPDHLKAWWEPSLCCLHPAAWWRKHWERSGVAEVELADELPDGWKYWLQWHREAVPDNHVEIAAVEADAGRYLGYARAVCRRKPAVPLGEFAPWPMKYEPAPLLRPVG